MNESKVGFIGTGFIGWNMAENFKDRGYNVVQYSLEEPYCNNFEAVKATDVLFIAVPTPTKDRKFVKDILYKVIKEQTFPWQKIVIKSTIIGWTTEDLQRMFPDRFFFHSAEFLTERNARNDVDSPSRNVVGSTDISEKYAQEIMDLLPKSEYNFLVKASESEMWKYFGNFLLASKIIMANLMYDICQKYGIDYEKVKEIAWSDPRIWNSHLDVVFEWWRWANGHCFPKDMATFHEMYWVDDKLGHILLEAMEMYNVELNKKTNKQPEIIKEVYWI